MYVCIQLVSPPILAYTGVYELLKSDKDALRRHKPALQIICDKQKSWQSRRESLARVPTLIKRIATIYSSADE